MNICVLYLGKAGGGNVYTFKMVEALLEKGVNVTVILSKYIENKDKFYELRKKNLPLCIYEVKTYNSKSEFILRSLNLFNFWRLRAFILKKKFDWLYIPMISIWASILSFFLPNNLNIITTIHDVNLHKGEENWFIETINTHLIKKSKKIITLTDSFRKSISEKYKKDIANICWIEHANFDYYRPVDFVNKETVSYKILFFGRIREYKGISVLLDAMQEIIKINPKICLKIVGDGKFSKEDQYKIDKLGQSVQVINRWIKDEEIHTFFADIDIVILPYIEASQSGVIMTAYAFGKPVIVTDVGGLPDQVTSDTGVVIKAGSPMEITKAVISLYNEPDKIIRLGHNAYKKILNDYTWDKSAQKLIRFLTEQ